MPRDYLDFAFAYDFADVTVAAVRGRLDEGVEEFIGDFIEASPDVFWSKAAKPHRDTLLHGFIRNLNYIGFEPAIDDAADDVQLFRDLFNATSIDVPIWLTGGRVEGRRGELSHLVADAVDVVSDATFQLLFSDLPFLAAFHERVASLVDDYPRSGWETMFRGSGALRRASHLPTWLRKAVFFRDRGRCRRCERDLTGTVSTYSDVHLDHLRPLAQSGTNDATNFQLLCAECNLAKGGAIDDGPWWSETYW